MTNVLLYDTVGDQSFLEHLLYERLNELTAEEITELTKWLTDKMRETPPVEDMA